LRLAPLRKPSVNSWKIDTQNATRDDNVVTTLNGDDCV